MVGLSQRFIHDNVNLFMKAAIDAVSGDVVVDPTDADAGDLVEFFAEVPLTVALSLCPSGGGQRSSERETWREGILVTEGHPVEISIYDTGFEPITWPLVP